MSLEGHQHVAPDAERIDLLQAAELGKVDDEGGADYLAAGPPHQLDGRFRRASGGNEVVDDEDALARPHCILVHLAQSNPVPQRFVLEELEQALIVSLLCNGGHNFRHLLDRAPPMAAPRQVRLVEQHIEANWQKPFLIEDMATMTGSSIRSIYRAFRSSRGYSPSEFLKRQRLMQARSMLLQPDSMTTVTQVAFACGFSDVSRFSKEFSKAYGEAPSAVNRSKAKRPSTLLA